MFLYASRRSYTTAAAAVFPRADVSTAASQKIPSNSATILIMDENHNFLPLLLDQLMTQQVCRGR